MKKQSTNALPSTVNLDCAEQGIFNKPFEFEHAQNIFDIQEGIKRNDWTLSKGQNLNISNGKIIYTGATDKAEDTIADKGAEGDKEA